MKIIKRGTPPTEIIWRGTCLRCETVAECFETEVKPEHDMRDGGRFAHVTCPVCNGDMLFYPKNGRERY